MKDIFVIDWILIPSFILSAYTGVELHRAGHGDTHEIWHNWAVFHVVVSLLFFIAAMLHVAKHWHWYKGIKKKGIDRKSKITLGLSMTFMLVVSTGIVLLNVTGANSVIGLWHYRIGLLASLFSMGHILKRIPILRKSLR